MTALYSPPKCNIKSDLYRCLLQSFGDRSTIGGDFNSKRTHWRSRLTTTKGKQLFKAANEMKCDFLSTRKPTYWPVWKNTWLKRFLHYPETPSRVLRHWWWIWSQFRPFSGLSPLIQKNEFRSSFPISIKSMIAEKRKLRRKWQRSRDPVIKTNLNKNA